MAYDPVFDRQMFQPKSSKGKGIVALADDNADTSDLDLRRQKAMEMLAQARHEQDPANFQMLSDRERPMVFRPTAVNLPQQPQQPPVAQQMAQMQAAGLHPVGMAEGGIARFGYAGINGSFVTPDGPVGLDTLSDVPKLPSLEPTIKTPEASSIVDTSKALTNMSDDELRELAVENARKLKSNVGKTEFSRKMQNLTNGNIPVSSNDIVTMPEDQLSNILHEDLQKTKQTQEDRLRKEEAVLEAKKAKNKAGIGSLFEELTPEQYAARKQKAAAASAAASAAFVAPSGFDAQTAGGSGDYMSRVPATPPAEIKIDKPYVPVSDKDAPDKDHPTNLRDIKAEKTDNFNLALIRAGLGMAAGKSSNPLTNIAEGGIQGIEQYATQAGRDRAANLEQQKLDITKQHYKMLRDVAKQRAENTSNRLVIATEAAQLQAAKAVKREFNIWLTSAEGMQASRPDSLTGAAIIKAKQKELEDYYGKLAHKQAALTAMSSDNGLGLNTDLFGGE
jgi:hypothetical protein